MRKFAVSPLVVAILLPAGASGGADPADPVQEKLNTAKKTYAEDIAKYKKAAVDYFDRQERLARQAGDKGRVDRIKEERAAFEDRGELPSKAIVEARMRSRAIKTLESAYLQAIREYTRRSMDKDAAEIEKRLERFGRTEVFPPGRYTVKYDKGVGTAVTDLKKDGTFVRERLGKSQKPETGPVQYSEGKLIMRCALFVEVWSIDETKIDVVFYYPASTYPKGMSNATGNATRLK